MFNEVAELWVAELRSDNWTKGKGYMKRRIGADVLLHCPLGILCEIAVREGVSVSVEMVDGGPSGDTFWRYDGTYAAPPVAVAEWAGEPGGYLLGGWSLVVPDSLVDELNRRRLVDSPFYRRGGLIPLADINDWTDTPFKEIAGYIELSYM
jgi:hypothetical protein